MRRVVRQINRKERLTRMLAAAVTPQERVAIAVDHYRSALAICPDANDAERVVAILVDAGDRLYRRKEGKARVRDAQ